MNIQTHITRTEDFSLFLKNDLEISEGNAGNTYKETSLEL